MSFEVWQYIPPEATELVVKVNEGIQQGQHFLQEVTGEDAKNNMGYLLLAGMVLISGIIGHGIYSGSIKLPPSPMKEARKKRQD